MPGTHFPAAQVQHAERQASAGVRWRQVQSNQGKVFGKRARVPSKATIYRWAARGPRSTEELRCRRVRPGRTLTRRHKRLLRDAMERSSQTRSPQDCTDAPVSCARGVVSATLLLWSATLPGVLLARCGAAAARTIRPIHAYTQYSSCTQAASTYMYSDRRDITLIH